MDHQISHWKIKRQARLILCVWVFFCALSIFNFYVNAQVRGSAPSWWSSAGFPLAQYGMLALLTLPVLYFTKYVESAVPRRAWWIATHVGGAVIVIAIDSAGWMLVPSWIRPDLAQAPNLLAKFEKSFIVMLEWNFWLYWTIVGIAYGVQYYYEMRDARVRAAELERELVQSQLQTLKQQLRPHFLFNTLNAISALMHTDSSAADDMIGNLSSLLRLSLDCGEVQCVPLREELSALQLYLDIQQARFGTRFKVDMRIEPDTLDAYVPHLILQPLVENAFTHGIAKRTTDGLLLIQSQKLDDLVCLRVMDNGPGSGGRATQGKGVGLSNTRARLRRLYGKMAKLKISESGRGFAVEATFPFVGPARDLASI